MTEKRFNVVDLLETLAISDGDECKYYQNCNDDWLQLRDLLNSLNDENEQLKKDIKEYEKEALENDWEYNNEYDAKLMWHTKYEQVKKENEQLKQTIREVTELLTDEVDVFSDKAVEHDINAYIELKELDNKDAFYMAKATKTAIKMLKGVVE